LKTTLRLLALVVLIAANVWWLKAGASRGWTKTLVPVTTLDEVTGLQGITYERRVVPGLDLLGAAWVVALALGGTSFFFAPPHKTNTTQEPAKK
jgi:hypothetical protein